MALEIVEVGDPVLREPARELSRAELLSPSIVQLVEQMREAMRAAPGVGLAAPQVGRGLALAVIEDRGEYHSALTPEELARRGRVPVAFHVVANPRMVVIDATPALHAEGCLSVPGLAAEVPRASAVRVHALDHAGEPITIDAQGWYARILQHEIDHLAGTLYVDRMHSRTLTTLRQHAARRSAPAVTR